MITAEHIRQMIIHWLDTPPNGYFAQGYGADAKAMLLKELSADTADDFLRKLRRDIPIIDTLDEEQLSISVETVGFDRINVVLSIGNIDIQLNDNPITDIDQDYYNVSAQ
ncbi:hypothetical protein MN210_08180 [Psychrobacter raelei]|uniref:Uncharacterized protein n=1 Tax=Psychrobacter raelei TaxID=2565531 RepID=A0AAT9PHE3_9GAMM|nr:hypothetical protein [Psychrobacter sp. PraFG1]UNK06461.1 hypothetical protein MN210_08180 [Psychrobacter sp. PraFG1]